jgi:hypothetical protein
MINYTFLLNECTENKNLQKVIIITGLNAGWMVTKQSAFGSLSSVPAFSLFSAYKQRDDILVAGIEC